jgi:hypothetical protein
MMGIGQVVTLRVPPEFYPTYDYRPIWEEERRKRR